MSSYNSTFAVNVRNAGVTSLYWEASIVTDPAPAWPEGSGLSVSPSTIQGPIEFDENDTLMVTFTAVDGMLKADSPFTGTLTIRGYADRNKITLLETVVQTCNLHIFTRGILAIVGTLTYYADDDDSTPIEKTATISNTGDVALDWDTLLVLDADIESLMSLDVESGSLNALANTAVVLTLSDPSAVPVGVHLGTLTVQDPAEWSDSVQLPVSVTIVDVPDLVHSYCNVTGTAAYLNGRWSYAGMENGYAYYHYDLEPDPLSFFIWMFFATTQWKMSQKRTVPSNAYVLKNPPGTTPHGMAGEYVWQLGPPVQDVFVHYYGPDPAVP